jgi:hypothetical protein
MLMLVLGACRGTDAVDATARRESKTEAVAPADVAAPALDGAPVGEVGVAACDAYLARMTACLSRLPPEAAAPARDSMQTQARAWRDATTTPPGRAAIGDVCARALDAARAAYAPMGCAF